MRSCARSAWYIICKLKPPSNPAHDELCCPWMVNWLKRQKASGWSHRQSAWSELKSRSR